MSLSLDSRTIQRSNKRLVISGTSYELYLYSEPYFFNWPPDSRTTNESIAQTERDDERREDNLRVARRAIRRLVDANKDQHGQLPKFVTFTFADQVKDLDEANKQWSAFQKRLKYEYGYSMRYMTVVEFHKSGAIHYHALFFNMPFKSQLGDYLSSIWKQGFVNARAVHRVKALGSYLSKYLTKQGADKRLNGRKAYFTSRQLLRPIEFRNPETIDRILARATIIEATEMRYITRQFGEVIYSYKIIKKSHAGDIKNSGVEEYERAVCRT